MKKSNPFSLYGKTILVTGASSGIGKAIAILCSRQGAKLIITGRNKERLNKTFSELTGIDHTQIIADLSKENDIENLVEKVNELDGLVNNAGISRRILAKDINAEKLYNMIHTNFSAQVLLTKALLKERKVNRDASIVFISSRGADRPTIGNALYSASKGAINSYARVLALEVAPKNIRVNCILPGMVWTPLLDDSPLPIDNYKTDEQRYPLGRYGQPEDVAYLSIYLLSDASIWMTGSSVTIDGGISLR